MPGFDLQILVLLLFIITGGAGLLLRLFYDVNQGALNYGKKKDSGTKQKAARAFHLQLVCSLLSILFLVSAVYLGYLKTHG